MRLERPIVTFDIESTGTDTQQDRIVQIAGIKTFPDGTTEEKNMLINPTIPIPEGASEVHGITDEMVKDAPKFSQVAKGIKQWFEGCDISGFNSDSFDVNLLASEMERCGVVFIDWDCNFVDVMKLYRHLYPNTLSGIYWRMFGEELEGAHDALADVKATNRVLKYILLNHPEIEAETPQEIDLFLQGDKGRVDMAGKMYLDKNDGIVKWTFSKNKGEPVLADKGFMDWVLKQDFPADTKDKIKELKSKL